MTPKTLLTRLIFMALIGAFAALGHCITAQWWSGLLLGLALAVGFTAFSERVLRANFFVSFVRLTDGLSGAYCAHLTVETFFYAVALNFISQVCNIHGGQYFWQLVGLGWLVLCQETLGKLVRLGLAWLTMRL